MASSYPGPAQCTSLRLRAREKATDCRRLTAEGEEAAVVSGLELGADDYVTKPFSGKVLVTLTFTEFGTREETS